MNNERIIKNLKVIAEAYEKGECLYYKSSQWDTYRKSGFEHLESPRDNLNYLSIDTVDYITESEYNNKIKYKDLVGKWLLSKNGNTKYKITNVESNHISYGDSMELPIEDLRKFYTLENGEEII